VRTKPEGGSLRLWVAGCASGEEAYSLAILIAEHLRSAGKRLDVRILATDINEKALAYARAGVYSEQSVSTLGSRRKQTYFDARGSSYQICREQREWVTFARHDLLSDPGFAALDLIVCRNVLIYFATPTQEHVVGVFHHALNPGGYLWLGLSETLGAQATHFDTVSRSVRLFRRIGTSVPQMAIPASMAVGGAIYRHPAPLPRTRASLGDAVRGVLLTEYAPASVVIDNQHDVVHFQGDVQAYLTFPSGEAKLNLKRMARRGLRRAIGDAVQQAQQSNRCVTVTTAFNRNGAHRPVQIAARPLRRPDLPEDLLLISFIDLGSETVQADMVEHMTVDDDPLAVQLEYELQVTQQESQIYIQRMEEANEETGAMNEELQVTNEELEASKEELQALNEELQTVNADLQGKYQELEAARNDWQNLLTSTDIATLFLDTQLNIRRFTPAIQHLFQLIDSDQGRPLSDIVGRYDESETLFVEVQAVIETLVPSEKEVRATDGRWYDRRIRPYRTHEDVVDGVVVTFVDVTERQRAAFAVESAHARAEHLIETLHEAVVVLDETLCVLSANHSFCTVFNTTQKAVENRSLFDLVAGQWDTTPLRRLLEDLRSHGTAFKDHEVALDSATAGERVMLLNARRLDDVQDETSMRILLAMTDISHQKRETQDALALASSEHRYRMLFEAIPMLCFTLEVNGRILSSNRYAGSTLGIEESALVGRDFIELHPDDKQQVRDGLADIAQEPSMARRWETRIVCAKGDLRWMRETACPVVGQVNSTPTILVLCEDITDQRRLPELAYHASHDSLTGLLNRREFERRANQLIHSARNEQVTHVMGFIDLDQFKIVNDTGGHLVGDAVLRQVAQMLRVRIRDSDILARLGGDEFGLLLSHCTIADAERVADQLLNDMQALRASSETEVLPVGMSIGLAAITSTTANYTEILRAADAACYQAKSHGRHRSYVYQNQDMDLTQRQHEFEWVGRVTRALKDQRLRLVYQPVVPIAVALQDNTCTTLHACELLLRLIEQDGRVVSAGKFLQAVEQYGLISQLDQWVITTAFDWLRDRPAIAKRLDICTFNLSAQSLNDEQCLRLLRKRLTDGSVAPDKICLEITETAATRHLDGALQSIETLRELGAHFALDDFGSGLTSFTYLRTLPACFLKIDAALIARILHRAGKKPPDSSLAGHDAAQGLRLAIS
jgi:diguanylate cyclase (GGDEF)-like protein/PAS domain S-box-containing protein